MKKIYKIMALACVACLCAAVAVGCSSSSSSSSDSSSSSTETTKLIVGFDQEYPPYGYIGDDGEYTGFDLDLAQEVCERLGWEYEAEPIDWDAKDALLESGTITCIWNGFTMEGREDDYAFSEPYMLNEQVVVVKAGSGIADFTSLAGKTVITQKGSAAETVLTDEEGLADLAETFASLETIGDYNNAFMQLESGAVDAVACDLSIAAYQMAANEGAYEQLSSPLSSEHYAVGFKLGDEDMAEQVTETLKAMYEDGTVAEILEKYADQGMDISNWVLK